MEDTVVSDESGLLSLEQDEIAAAPKQGRGKLVRKTVLAGAVLGTVAALALLTKSSATNMTQMSNDITGLSVASTITCYVPTGGTCVANGCDATRGATCEWGKCLCRGNKCAGPDGKCHSAVENTLIKAHFALINVQWPKYGMYVQSTSAFGQLKTTSAPHFLNNGKDYFNLYKMAGPQGGAPKYILQSSAWAQTVARLAHTTGTAFSTQGLYATDLNAAYGPDQIALSVCYSHTHKALAFGNDAGDVWAYIHHGSWLVYGFHGSQHDAGEGALWEPDPPFTPEEFDKVPDCTVGTR